MFYGGGVIWGEVERRGAKALGLVSGELLCSSELGFRETWSQLR